MLLSFSSSLFSSSFCSSSLYSSQQFSEEKDLNHFCIERIQVYQFIENNELKEYNDNLIKTFHQEKQLLQQQSKQEEIKYQFKEEIQYVEYFTNIFPIFGHCAELKENPQDFEQLRANFKYRREFYVI